MPLDVASVRAHFPALTEGAAHFDGPGGSQTPDVVGRAVADTLTSAISNRGTVTASERRAEQVVTDCRAALADLLGADPRGIVFGRSATALTYDLARALAKDWGPGDEVVVTRLDHDANIRPVGAGRRGGRRHRALGRLRPRHRRAVGGCRGGRALRAHPARRHHRRLQPDRHPHAGLPGRPTSPTRWAPCTGSTGCTPPPTPRSTSRRCAPTSGPARPTSSWARTAACSPPTRRCSRPCTPTSCCRRRTPCPSGSSSAPCPTS